MNRMKFKGLKFSSITEIFYKVVDGELYALPVYKGARTIWHVSGYRDRDGLSSTWVNSTEKSMEKFIRRNKQEKEAGQAKKKEDRKARRNAFR